MRSYFWIYFKTCNAYYVSVTVLLAMQMISTDYFPLSNIHYSLTHSKNRTWDKELKVLV